jgi:hypothetical protein
VTGTTLPVSGPGRGGSWLAIIIMLEGPGLPSSSCFKGRATESPLLALTAGHWQAEVAGEWAPAGVPHCRCGWVPALAPGRRGKGRGRWSTRNLGGTSATGPGDSHILNVSTTIKSASHRRRKMTLAR